MPHSTSIQYKLISQIACGSYHDFLDRGSPVAKKLFDQRSLVVKLKSLLRKFYDRHHDLVNRYGISGSQMTTDPQVPQSQSRPFQSYAFSGGLFVTSETRRVSLVEQEF